MTNEATFLPIKGTAGDWNYEREDGVRVLNDDNQAEITELLVGHRVIKVDGEHLMLDNGTVIKAIGRDGGCSCSAGCYNLSVLNGVDNIITSVSFDYRPGGDGDEEWTGYYRVFVFADNEQINLMQFDGTDGNGYYGTGFEILVRSVA